LIFIKTILTISSKINFILRWIKVCPDNLKCSRRFLKNVFNQLSFERWEMYYKKMVRTIEMRKRNSLMRLFISNIAIDYPKSKSWYVWHQKYVWATEYMVMQYNFYIVYTQSNMLTIFKLNLYNFTMCLQSFPYMYVTVYSGIPRMSDCLKSYIDFKIFCDNTFWSKWVGSKISSALRLNWFGSVWN